MKKKSTSKSAFFNVRVLIGVLVASIGALLAFLLDAFPNTLRADPKGASSTAHLRQIADDRDPELVKKRQQFLETFFGRGPGGVSPGEYANALAAARALPPSPLLQGKTFTPTTGWTFPVPPPITNSYGADATAQIHSIAIDPSNANVVYTGSFGGLAKTTDGGSSWQYLSDTWSSQSVTAIAIDYNSHSLGSNKFVYVGTGRDTYGPYGVGIYRSFDGGATWTGPLGAAQFGGAVIHAIATIGSGSQSSATVYVGSTSGLWRSTDSGSTWTFVYQRPRGYPLDVFDIAKDPWSSAIYITTYDGMLKSVDSGQTWTLIFPNASWDNRLGLITPNHSFSSWLYFIDPDHPSSNFFKSTNGGSNWVQIPTHCPVGASSCAGTEIGLAVFAADPANPQVIVAGNWGEGGGAVTLFQTNNEGVSWTELSPWGGPIHADQHTCEFSSGGEAVYVGNDGGIIKSTDSGSNWTNLNHSFSGALLYSAALSSDGRMIAGTQDNGVVFDNLGPWDAIFGGDSGYDLIDPNNSTNAYWVIYDVPDYGYNRFNWTTYQKIDITPDQIRNERFFFFPAFSMNPLSPAHVITAGQHVARTLDAPHVTTGGWTLIGGDISPIGGTVKTAVEAPNNSNFIYAITGDHYLIHSVGIKLTTSANSGTSASWTDITSNLVNTGDMKKITIDPTNPQIAYLAADHGIYKTTNAGGSWTQIGTPNLVYYDVAIEPGAPNYLYAACNAGVFSSTDSGVTWANISAGIPAGMAVTSLCLNRADHSFNLTASTYGRGVYAILLPVPRP